MVVYNLNFTTEQLSIILSALSEQPYKLVVQTIVSIQEQLQTPKEEVSE